MFNRYQKITYDDAFPETSREDLFNLLDSNFDADTQLTFQVNVKSFKLSQFNQVRVCSLTYDSLALT
jgi:hypothetical protein